MANTPKTCPFCGSANQDDLRLRWGTYELAACGLTLRRRSLDLQPQRHTPPGTQGMRTHAPIDKTDASQK